MLGVSLSLTCPLNQTWIPDWKYISEVCSQPCLIWGLCSPFLPSPSCLKRAFLFQRELYILCRRCISEMLLIFIATSSLLGVVPNVGFDSLGKRNLWVLYARKSYYPYLSYHWRLWCSIWGSLYWEDISVSFLAWLGFGRQNLLSCVMPLYDVLTSHLCLASTFNWLSCNGLIRAPNTVGCAFTKLYWTVLWLGWQWL